VATRDRAGDVSSIDFQDGWRRRLKPSDSEEGSNDPDPVMVSELLAVACKSSSPGSVWCSMTITAEMGLTGPSIGILSATLDATPNRFSRPYVSVPSAATVTKPLAETFVRCRIRRSCSDSKGPRTIPSLLQPASANRSCHMPQRAPTVEVISAASDLGIEWRARFDDERGLVFLCPVPSVCPALLYRTIFYVWCRYKHADSSASTDSIQRSAFAGRGPTYTGDARSKDAENAGRGSMYSWAITNVFGMEEKINMTIWRPDARCMLCNPFAWRLGVFESAGSRAVIGRRRPDPRTRRREGLAGSWQHPDVGMKTERRESVSRWSQTRQGGAAGCAREECLGRLEEWFGWGQRSGLGCWGGRRLFSDSQRRRSSVMYHIGGTKRKREREW